MPAILANAKNFLFNSDYPSDKIIWQWEGIHLATSGLSYLNVTHGLLFQPLVSAVWSTTADFDTTYSIGDGTPGSSGLTGVFDITVNQASADSTEVEIPFVKNSVGNQTVYVRLWAFMPSDIDLDASFTAITADDFVLNTEYNYTKLLEQGVTAASSVLGSSVTINHDLGYYPQVEVWSVRNSETYTLKYTISYDGTADYSNARLTTSSLILTRSQYLIATTEAFHYRIYVDEL